MVKVKVQIADIAKFKDFSPLGDEIQTDSKLSSQDYYKTSFTLSQKPSTQLSSVEIIEPYKDASYCLDDTNSNIPFYYVLQTSDNQPPKLEAKYVITFEREATKKEGTIQLTKGMHTSKTEDVIAFPQAVSSLKGEGSNKAKITYDLYNTETKTKIESKSVDFSVRVPEEGSDCSEVSFLYDYKPLEGEKENAETESTEGTEGGDASTDIGGK